MANKSANQDGQDSEHAPAEVEVHTSHTSPLRRQKRGVLDRVLSFFGWGFNTLKKDVQAERELTQETTKLFRSRRELEREANLLENVDREIEQDDIAAERKIIEERNKRDDAQRKAKHKELRDKIEEERLKARLAEERHKRKRYERGDSTSKRREIREEFQNIIDKFPDQVEGLRRLRQERDAQKKRVEEEHARGEITAQEKEDYHDLIDDTFDAAELEIKST